MAFSFMRLIWFLRQNLEEKLYMDSLRQDIANIRAFDS